MLRVHPIQLNYKTSKSGQVCGLCGSEEPRKSPETNDRTAHLVHLVREHLRDVQDSLMKSAQKEEVLIDE